MTSAAKQTKMSESGAEKGLLQDHARRQVAQDTEKTQSSHKGFGKAFSKVKAREGGGRVCDEFVHNSLIG